MNLSPTLKGKDKKIWNPEFRKGKGAARRVRVVKLLEKKKKNCPDMTLSK